MSFSFEVREVPGDQALEALKSLAVPGRVLPVLLGGPEDVDRVMDNHESYEESPEELLEAAREIDAPVWLKEREAENDRYTRPVFRGDWPAVAKPATKEEALALAWEQFVYCPDIVTQGTETVEVLAAALLNGPVWLFLWD